MRQAKLRTLRKRDQHTIFRFRRWRHIPTASPPLGEQPRTLADAEVLAH